MTTPSTQSAAAEAQAAFHAEAFDPAAERGLLVVQPHPDDESFSCGGTMARCSDAGVPVTYLCGTYGNMGRRMGRPAFATRESLRDIREVELADACKVLGAEVRQMGMLDKCVEFEDPQEVAARIREVILELAPSSVITYYPGYATHPDHDALGYFTQLAVRGLPQSQRPRLLAVPAGDRDSIRAAIGEPQLASDIGDTQARKLDALRAHRSQTEVMFDKFDLESPDDPQLQVFRHRLLETERFYLLDPDQVTDYQRSFER